MNEGMPGVPYKSAAERLAESNQNLQERYNMTPDAITDYRNAEVAAIEAGSATPTTFGLEFEEVKTAFETGLLKMVNEDPHKLAEINNTLEEMLKGSSKSLLEATNEIPIDEKSQMLADERKFVLNTIFGVASGTLAFFLPPATGLALAIAAVYSIKNTLESYGGASIPGVKENAGNILRDTIETEKKILELTVLEDYLKQLKAKFEAVAANQIKEAA